MHVLILVGVLYLVAGSFLFIHTHTQTPLLPGLINVKFPLENGDAHEWHAKARQMEMKLELKMARQLKSALTVIACQETETKGKFFNHLHFFFLSSCMLSDLDLARVYIEFFVSGFFFLFVGTFFFQPGRLVDAF